MTHPSRLALTALACLLMAGAARADGITGAGSGSTGGTITGKTNETSPDQMTGSSNGTETVPNEQDKRGVGTGDNAVLNAPRETVPGTLPKSQPSNLNGQSAQP